MELKFKQFQLNKLLGKSSSVSPIELKDFIDFEVKRVYYISNIQSETGQHCHKEEKELFVMVQGNCNIVIDGGKGKEEIKMREGTVLYVGSYVWHGFKNASSDAIIFALSSTNYTPDRTDYIEDYEEYTKAIKTI
jgi:mannose-6-phosphate isomerase-like protein (cupin superfamily)